VFIPLTEYVPAEPLFAVRLTTLNCLSAPKKDPAQLMIEEVETTVRFPAVAPLRLKELPGVRVVIVLELIFNTLIAVPVAMKLKAVTLNPFVINDPAVTVILPEDPVTIALPRVHSPPTPLKLIPLVEPILAPLVVTVLPVDVELNVIPTFEFHMVPETRNIDPLIFKVGEVPVTNVTVPLETLISKQFSAPDNVTVYVPDWSKNTESLTVGTDAPLGPPDVSLQLVVLNGPQVPEPPTQYLFAMLKL
jgi:hypothetical protein